MSRDDGLAPGWLCLVMWLGVQLVVPLCVAAQTVRGAARVNTTVDRCVPIDTEQFHRLLAIELGTSIEYSPTAAQQPNGTLVRVGCTQDAVQLQLEDSLTRKSMQRVVELPDVDIATRTRLLALSVAEFVVASWVELRLAQPPIAPVGPAVPAQAARDASQFAQARLPAAPAPASSQAPAAQTPVSPRDATDATPRGGTGSATDTVIANREQMRSSALPRRAFPTRWLLSLSFEPVLFMQDARLVPQVTLHVEQRPNEHIGLGLAVSLGHARWSVHYPNLIAGSAGITNSSARLSVAYITKLKGLELSFGAGARGGIVYMAGSTNQSDVFWAVNLYGPWGGPVLLLSAAVPIGSVRLAVELEAGFVTLPVQAMIADSVVAQLRGFWGAGGLSFGFLF